MQVDNTGEIDLNRQIRRLKERSLLREARRQEPVIVGRHDPDRLPGQRKSRDRLVNRIRQRRLRNHLVHDGVHLDATASDRIEERLRSVVFGVTGRSASHTRDTSSQIAEQRQVRR